MVDRISKAVVIGAGTMGAAIAAHLANAGIWVNLLDIVPDKPTEDEARKGLSLQDRTVRDRFARQGLERALASRPASFFTPEHADRVRVGNIEDDLGLVSEADWVIEAIVENLDIKRALMERIDSLRGKNTIVSTNTSGIPVHSIAEGRSAAFSAHFLGTHFFNPPRYLKLLELIPTPDTDPAVIAALRRFGEFRLGKGVVLCKDTPNFIANRLGSVTGAFALDYILEHGYTVAEVDALTGPLIGRPKTATFRLLDLVGIDVANMVRQNLAEAIPHDEFAQRYLRSDRAAALQQALIERGWLGNKTRQGFYKEVRENGSKAFWPLNLETLEYEPPEKIRFESVGRIRDLERLEDRLKALLTSEDRAGDLLRALTYSSLAYASYCIPEIADTPRPIDDAMRWGFMNEAGPFEIWDLLGVSATAEMMAAAGFTPAGWVAEMLAGGVASFYQYQDGRRIGVYHPDEGAYVPLPPPERIIGLRELKSRGRTLESNTGASLIDLGDGVLCVEFHTKMNALDDDIGRMIAAGLDRIERGEYEGLVLGTDAENFSAGANLFAVVLAAQNGMWDQLEQAVSQFQELNQRIRYSPRPVVAAPGGLALGGGAELMMHTSRVVAHAELYTGLVEVGAGVIPAGGGVKEMIRRLINPVMRIKNNSVLPVMQQTFEQIGQAKVATSAEEARRMGLLGSADRVVMNRDHLLAEAKREVLYLAASGYQPPMPEKIYAAGRDVLAALRVGIFLLHQARQITDYERVIGNKLAAVLTGGELSRPTWVAEQYILDLEREAFLSLCGETKTQERMWHILQTGKPLRN